MEFSRQEYWNRFPFLSPRHLPDPGVEPMCPLYPALQEDLLPTEPPGKPQEGAGGGGLVTKLCLTL